MMKKQKRCLDCGRFIKRLPWVRRRCGWCGVRHAKKRDYDRYVKNRDKVLARAKAYREEHRSEYLLRKKNDYAKHREARLARCSAYSKTHREQIKGYHKAYYKAHPEMRIKNKAWREKHRDEVMAYFKFYYAAHRNKYKEYRVLHRERRLAQGRAWRKTYNFIKTQHALEQLSKLNKGVKR